MKTRGEDGEDRKAKSLISMAKTSGEDGEDMLAKSLISLKAKTKTKTIDILSIRCALTGAL
jgi:hypothetical protein